MKNRRVATSSKMVGGVVTRETLNLERKWSIEKPDVFYSMYLVEGLTCNNQNVRVENAKEDRIKGSATTSVSVHSSLSLHLC
jgi:hypothetical protein